MQSLSGNVIRLWINTCEETKHLNTAIAARGLRAGLIEESVTKQLSKLVRHRQELDTLISTQLAHISARRIPCVRHWSVIFLFSVSIRDHHQYQHTLRNSSRNGGVCRCDWQAGWSKRPNEAIDQD
jgi:hypothetical protein